MAGGTKKDEENTERSAKKADHEGNQRKTFFSLKVAGQISFVGFSWVLLD
jgi:hypothetical protein